MTIYTVYFTPSILLMDALLIVLPIMSYFYKPLIPLIIFFYTLAVIHLFVVPLAYKTMVKYVGIILLYTVIINITLFWHGVKSILFYLLTPFIAVLLISSREILKGYIAFQIKRIILSKPIIKGFDQEVKKFSIQFTNSHKYNLVVWIAFCITGIVGYVFEMPSDIIMVNFVGNCILLIVVFSAMIIAKEAKEMATMLNMDIMPADTTIESNEVGNHFGLMRLIEEKMKLSGDESREVILDYFDKTAEIRKLRYYNSLSMLMISTAYLSIYTLLPNKIVPIDMKWVILIIVVSGVLAIQLPYYIGQKKLAMNLTLKYSGTEYREMLKLLGKESPAWSFLQIGEILGTGLIPIVIIWCLQRLFEGINS